LKHDTRDENQIPGFLLVLQPHHRLPWNTHTHTGTHTHTQFEG